MQTKTFASLCLLVCLTLSSVVAYAQDCNPPAISANSQNYNIFSPEQEMILGELTYQRMGGEHRYLEDEKLLAYVREIGERLVRHLPPTGLKFQFFIVDIPDANAFNTPGGYVFLSRKLIAFTKTEDELAGVMAHELGHLLLPSYGHARSGIMRQPFRQLDFMHAGQGSLRFTATESALLRRGIVAPNADLLAAK